MKSIYSIIVILIATVIFICSQCQGEETLQNHHKYHIRVESFGQVLWNVVTVYFKHETH
jgi:hypothetical protein